MDREFRFSLQNDSRFRPGRLKEGTINQRDAKMSGQPKLVVGSKDALESNYGAELEGPFGLIWFSKDGRMLVWSYATYGRAKIAALNMERKSFLESPRIEFL